MPSIVYVNGDRAEQRGKEAWQRGVGSPTDDRLLLPCLLFILGFSFFPREGTNNRLKQCENCKRVFFSIFMNERKEVWNLVEK